MLSCVVDVQVADTTICSRIKLSHFSAAHSTNLLCSPRTKYCSLANCKLHEAGIDCRYYYLLLLLACLECRIFGTRPS